MFQTLRAFPSDIWSIRGNLNFLFPHSKIPTTGWEFSLDHRAPWGFQANSFLLRSFLFPFIFCQHSCLFSGSAQILTSVLLTQPFLICQLQFHFTDDPSSLSFLGGTEVSSAIYTHLTQLPLQSAGPHNAYNNNYCSHASAFSKQHQRFFKKFLLKILTAPLFYLKKSAPLFGTFSHIHPSLL